MYRERYSLRNIRFLKDTFGPTFSKYPSLGNFSYPCLYISRLNTNTLRRKISTDFTLQWITEKNISPGKVALPAEVRMKVNLLGLFQQSKYL